MARYRMLRMGKMLRPFTQDETDKNTQKAIEGLQELMSVRPIQLEWFECDCAEKLSTQETFTKQEVYQIMHCPVNH